MEVIFLDSFLTVTNVEDGDTLAEIVKDIDIISEKFGVRMVLSISMNSDALPESVRPMVSLAL